MKTVKKALPATSLGLANYLAASIAVGAAMAANLSKVEAHGR